MIGRETSKMRRTGSPAIGLKDGGDSAIRQSVESEGRWNALLQRSRGENGLSEVLKSPIISNSFRRMETPTVCNTLSMPQILGIIWRDHKPFVALITGMMTTLMLAFIVLVTIIAIGNCRMCTAFCNDGRNSGTNGNEEAADRLKSFLNRTRCNMAKVVNDTSRETELRLRKYFNTVPLSRCTETTWAVHHRGDRGDRDNGSDTTEVTILGPELTRAAETKKIESDGAAKTKEVGSDDYDLFSIQDNIRVAERQAMSGVNDAGWMVKLPMSWRDHQEWQNRRDNAHGERPAETEGDVVSDDSNLLLVDEAGGGRGRRAQASVQRGDVAVIGSGGNCACIFAGNVCRCLADVPRLHKGEVSMQPSTIELDNLE